jgi:hypothetical protein
MTRKSNIILAMLSPLVENGLIARVHDLDEQLQKIICENQNYRLFKENFMVDSGVNYSPELAKTYDTLSCSGYFEIVMNERDRLIKPFTELSYKEGLIDADIEFLKTLGRQIDVKERYKVEKKE